MAYRSKTKRAKYGSNKSYEKYKTQVWNAMHIDSVMPPLSELIPAGAFVRFLVPVYPC
jgi:hypothetical protein